MNKYCNLDGSKKIKDDFGKINDGFGKVEMDIDDIDSRVDTIITTQVEGVSAQEIIDARDGEPTLGDNVNGIKTDLLAHKAENIHQGVNVNLSATSTDEATGVTNAPLKTAGGLGVSKNIMIRYGNHYQISRASSRLTIGTGASNDVFAALNPGDRIVVEFTANRYILHLLEIAFTTSPGSDETDSAVRALKLLCSFKMNSTSNGLNYYNEEILYNYQNGHGLLEVKAKGNDSIVQVIITNNDTIPMGRYAVDLNWLGCHFTSMTYYIEKV